MKDFTTITEYQLICLAIKGLQRRKAETQRKIDEYGETHSLISRLNTYSEQIKELLERVAEINNATK